MKKQLLNDLKELNFEDMEMYFFYIKNLVENNDNIGTEVIGQVKYFIDDLENIMTNLIKLGHKK